MDWLRTVVFQDVCEMKLRGRDHLMFNHEVLKHPDFLNMMEDMRPHIENLEPPLEQQLQAVVPALCDRMNSMQSTMMSNFTAVHNRTTEIQKRMVMDVQMRAITHGIASVARDVFASLARKKWMSLQDAVNECDGKTPASPVCETTMDADETPMEVDETSPMVEPPRILQLASKSEIPAKLLTLQPCSDHTLSI